MRDVYWRCSCASTARSERPSISDCQSPAEVRKKRRKSSTKHRVRLAPIFCERSLSADAPAMHSSSERRLNFRTGCDVNAGRQTVRTLQPRPTWLRCTHPSVRLPASIWRCCCFASSPKGISFGRLWLFLSVAFRGLPETQHLSAVERCLTFLLCKLQSRRAIECASRPVSARARV